MKDTVIFHRDWFESIQHMSAEERSACYDAIFRYAFDGVRPTDKLTLAATSLILSHIDDARAKYDEVCEKRRQAVGKRWHKDGNDLPKSDVVAVVDAPVVNVPAPERDEVLAYFVEYGGTKELGERFFDYYESENWTTTAGNHLVNWQARARRWMHEDFQKEESKNKKNGNEKGKQHTRLASAEDFDRDI